LDGGIASGNNPLSNGTPSYASTNQPPPKDPTPAPSPAPAPAPVVTQSAPVQTQTNQPLPKETTPSPAPQTNFKPNLTPSSTLSTASRPNTQRTNSGSKIVDIQRTNSGSKVVDGTGSRTNSQTSIPSFSSPNSNDKQRRATVSEPSDWNASTLGGRTCPECNKSLSQKAKFCPACGAKTPPGTTGVPVARKASGADNQSQPQSQSQPSSSQSESSQAKPKSESDQICASCGGELSGQVAKALDRLWHKDCFTCKTCHKSLVSTSFVPDDSGNPMCSDCYETRNLKKCSKCGQAIKTAYMEAGNSTYHKKCFVCSVCNKDLGSEYWMRDGQLLCADHVN